MCLSVYDSHHYEESKGDFEFAMADIIKIFSCAKFGISKHY